MLHVNLGQTKWVIDISSLAQPILNQLPSNRMEESETSMVSFHNSPNDTCKWLKNENC